MIKSKRRKFGPTPAVRIKVIGRAAGLCEVCGQPGTDMHHRRPRGSGGSSRPCTNQPSNLLWLCRGCHSEIELNRDFARKLGRLLYQSQDPATVPVTLWGTRVLLPNTEGPYIPYLEQEAS